MAHELALHDRVRLLRETDGVPAESVGTIVLVYERAPGVGVALDDRTLTARIDGIVDVPDVADLEFVPPRRARAHAA